MNKNILKDIQESKIINSHALSSFNIKNIYGNYWVCLSKVLIGTLDLRARMGTFNNPYNAKSSPLYAMPALRNIDVKLADLYDERAIEIFKNAKIQNKKICIMWSGGIDSTSILVSFLKNLSPSDHEILTVILTTTSIIENFNFYSKFISEKLNCLNYLDVEMTDDFLNKHIVIHGDPGDCLFGPSMPMYRSFIANGTHNTRWKDHLPKMKEELNKIAGTVMPHKNFGDWYVDKITNNLIDSKQDTYVSSISDWWWWAYFNFRWEFSCQRPFFYLRNFSCVHSISQHNINEFAKNTFFNTEKFQLWSYSNLKSLVGGDVRNHKKEIKEYIFHFDQDENFQKNKDKVGTFTPISYIRSKIITPFYYDKNWVGYDFGHKNLRNIAEILLEKYKG